MPEVGTLARELTYGKNDWFRYVLAETTPNGVYLCWDIFETIFNVNDPPFVFSVLRATEFTNDVTAFTQISPTLENIYSYTDTEIPSIGKWPNRFYMIKLATSLKIVYSPPITTFGGLTEKQRNIVKAALRRAHLSPRHLPHFESYLLKRRYTGTTCTCIDPVTKEVLQPDCTSCYGTGIVGGYYKEGSPKTLIFNSPLNSLEVFDNSVTIGTMNPVKMAAKFAGLPPVRRGDVFVHPVTNRRFYVTGSRVSSEIHGFPVIQDLELQLADVKDIIYRYTI